ncbi:MAG: NTP transferase domain-containing protein [Desulfobacterales bacterium]|nr:NTP transferase domain-containing protein [Desulfobacterales bacterium]
MNPQSVAALVLAAGSSRRMGEFKPMLTLGGQTILERVIRLFQSIGVDRIHVVTGHRAAELAPMVDRCGACSVLNPRHAEGMFTSVAAGVSSLDERTVSFFVLPVDIPLVRPATLRSLMEAYSAGTGGICHPTFQGRRGHPPLIGRRFKAVIADWQGEGGLRALLERFDAEAVDVPVADEFILQDMDGPEDHRRMGERLKTRAILSAAECRALLIDIVKVSPAVWAHSQAVAEQALRIGRALTTAGCRLDLGLIYAAALVHDMARGQPNHARRAAGILRELEMPLMAEIVEAHMDLDVEMEGSIREAEVVFLADKLICEDRFVGIDRRFAPRLQDQRADPRAAASIRSKREAARRSAERVEYVIGRPLASLRPPFHTAEP